MAPASSIATRNVARNAIIEAEIKQINDVEYSSKTARRWKHSIVAAAKNIPTKIAGAAGGYGHTYLVETTAQFHTQSVENAASVTNPGGLTYSTGVPADSRSTTMAQERTDHEVAVEAYRTQEGVTIGLRKAIIDSIPKELIVELEDDDTFFDEVLPLDLIAAVMANATL